VLFRSFDVVYVPQTGIAKFSNVMSQIRDSLPVSFTYAAGAGAIAY